MDLSHLPHKNLFLSGFAALLILGFGIYSSQEQPKKIAATNSHIAAKASATTSSLADLDSDHDGLPDWEEALYGTNIHDPDTDKDGTPDGEEVRNDRNPLKPNTALPGEPPNDKMVLIQDPNFATSSTDIDGLRKDFFAKYLEIQSKDIRETTFRDLIKGFDPAKYTPTNQLVDLNISGINTTEALRQYGNSFGALIKKYTSVHANRTEEEILSDGLKTKSDETLAELQLPAKVYANFSDDIKAIRVPSSIASWHLLIVNGYDGMSRGLLGMQHMFSNPIDGAGGYQVYTKTRFDVINGFAGVVAYFATHNVTFSEDEPGYVFTKNIVIPANGTGTPPTVGTSTI